MATKQNGGGIHPALVLVLLVVLVLDHALTDITFFLIQWVLYRRVPADPRTTKLGMMREEFVEDSVVSFATDQLVVTSFLDFFSLAQHDDSIYAPDGG